MNYLREINAFYDWLITNPIPADAQALWHVLMYINNKCAWQERFTVANKTLASLLGFSRQQLERMRNVLIQTGRIEYTKRDGRQAGIYRIVPFVSNNVTQHVTQTFVSNNVTQVETQPVTQLLTQPVTQTGHNQSTLNKLNKTKQEGIDVSNDTSAKSDTYGGKPLKGSATEPGTYSEAQALKGPEEPTKGLKEKGQAEPAVKRLIDHYFNCFVKKFGERPAIDGKKDGAIIKRLLSTYGEDKLKGLIDAFFESTDPFIRQSGYTIGVFKTQVNKLITSGTGRPLPKAFASIQAAVERSKQTR
jgi:hypothetical protein